MKKNTENINQAWLGCFSTPSLSLLLLSLCQGALFRQTSQKMLHKSESDPRSNFSSICRALNKDLAEKETGQCSH